MTRAGASMGIAGAVALGLASRVWPVGVPLWDKRVGDVAYATMIGFVLLFVHPRVKPIALGAITIAICVAVELFQLTGLPARAPRLVRLALGDTFAWHDLACYVLGAALPVLVVMRARVDRRA